MRLPTTAGTVAARAVAVAAVLGAASTLAVPAGIASPTTRHVAVDGAVATPGDCSGGTSTAPWRSIEHGMRCLRPGDTLVVHGGTYRERVLPIVRPGRPDAPITVTAAPGERPVVEGLVRLDGPSHWTVRGIDVTNDGQPYGDGEALVKMRGGRGWTWTDSEIWGGDSYASFRIETSEYAAVEQPVDWALTDSCLHDHQVGHPGQYTDHLLYVWTGPDDSNGLVAGNLFHGARNGQNIKLGEAQGPATGVTIRDNTLVDAYQNILLYRGTSDVTITGNVLGQVRGKDWYPAVRGFELSGDGVVVHDNYVFEARTAAFADQASTAAITTTENLQFRAPDWDTSGCDGFVPPAGSAASGHGHAPSGPRRAWTEVLAEEAGRNSVVVSRAVFPSGRTPAAVLARRDAYPDALAAGPLAAALQGPVLLVPSDGIDDVVRDELRRLGSPYVVLLGGTAALSERVEEDLRDLGLTSRRISGPDRFATAAAVANDLAERLPSPPRTAYVVEGKHADPGRGWPDAVSVSALASRRREPILLARRDSVPWITRATIDANGYDELVVAGGTAAISTDVAASLGTSAPTSRLSGADRYRTSEAIARASVADGADPERLFVTTGRRFQDALVAAPAAAQRDGTLLLVHGGRSEPGEHLAGWLDRHPDTGVVLVGGDAQLHPTLVAGLSHR